MSIKLTKTQKKNFKVFFYTGNIQNKLNSKSTCKSFNFHFLGKSYSLSISVFESEYIYCWVWPRTHDLLLAQRKTTCCTSGSIIWHSLKGSLLFFKQLEDDWWRVNANLVLQEPAALLRVIQPIVFWNGEKFRFIDLTQTINVDWPCKNDQLSILSFHPTQFLSNLVYFINSVLVYG